MRSDSLTSKEIKVRDDDALVHAVEYISGALNVEDSYLNETARKMLNDKEFCNALLEQAIGTGTWRGNVKMLDLLNRALRMESDSQANKK